MRSSYLEKLLGGEKRKGESAGIEGSYRAEGKGPGGRQSARSTWQKSLPLPSGKNSKVLRRRSGVAGRRQRHRDPGPGAPRQWECADLK